MTLTPLLEAPFIIQLHVAAALPAVVVGPFALFGRTSWRLHKVIGYAWVTAMMVLATSGLFIPSHDLAVIGHMGPIHLFSFISLWGITNGVWLARQGRIGEHRMAMKWTWYGAMGAAGLLNFLPGRTINQIVFGGPSDLGWVVIGAGGLLLVALWQRDRGQVLHAA